MTPEQRFSQLRAKNSREGLTKGEASGLILIAEALFSDRLTLRQRLDGIKHDFANLRQGLNLLDQTVSAPRAPMAKKR